MTAQTANKATVPVGSDGWNPTAHIKQAIETTRSIIPIGSDSERATLPGAFPGGVLPVPTFISRTDQGFIIETWNGTAWVTKPHAEFVTDPNLAPQNTAWGMGVFKVDEAKTTDSGFVTIAGTDKLKVRDAGDYAVVVSISFTKPITGVSWLGIAADYVVPMGGGLQIAGASMATLKLPAGGLIQPSLAHGSGVSPDGDRTFTSRVRVTRTA